MYKIRIIIIFIAIFLIALGYGIAFRHSSKQSTDLKGYNKKNINSCDIYFTPKDEKYATLAELQLSDNFKRLEKDFGLSVKKPAIVICPNESQLKKLININQAISAPMGAYKNNTIYILSPLCYAYNESIDYEFMKNGALIHELAHYMVDKKTNGRAKRWFSEGVALYYEYKISGYEWHKELKEKAKEISPNMLTDKFFMENEALAYRKAFDLINDKMNGKDSEYIQVLCEKGLN